MEVTATAPTDHTTLPHDAQMRQKSLNVGHCIDDPPPLVPGGAAVSGSRERYDFDPLLCTGIRKTGRQQVGTGSAVDPNQRKAVFRAGDEVVDVSAIGKRETLGHCVWLLSVGVCSNLSRVLGIQSGYAATL